MLEETKYTTEEAIRFLDVLEAENEEKFTRIIESIQEIEQKIREVDYTLEEYEEKQDSNMNFFSPVGVYEEGEEKRILLQKAEELKEKLPHLQEQLEQYKKRREQIQGLRKAFLGIGQRVEASNAVKCKGLCPEQGMHILESHEYERNRIARDLHDSSVQSLTCLVHKTELCMRLLDIDTIRVKLELQTMIDTIKTIINGMREIIYNLRPMSLDNLGLAVTIDAYCLQLKKSNDIEVVFQNDTVEPELPAIWKVTLYRILQEACCNVIKHAKANRIEIKLSFEKEKLVLEIRDNGIGFDTNKVIGSEEEQFHEFGLSMMKERVTLLCGTIQIDSTEGKGTTVIVEVPLKQKEEANGDDSSIIGG